MVPSKHTDMGVGVDVVFVLKAKEQGKIEVEELLAKLEKVRCILTCLVWW